jgi:hypothetical protein
VSLRSLCLRGVAAPSNRLEGAGVRGLSQNCAQLGGRKLYSPSQYQMLGPPGETATLAWKWVN